MQRLDKADFWFDCDGGFLVDQSRNLGGEGFDSGGGVAGVDEHQGLILVQPHCSTTVAAPIADMVEHPPKRDFVATVRHHECREVGELLQQLVAMSSTDDWVFKKLSSRPDGVPIGKLGTADVDDFVADS